MYWIAYEITLHLHIYPKKSPRSFYSVSRYRPHCIAAASNPQTGGMSLESSVGSQVLESQIAEVEQTTVRLDYFVLDNAIVRYNEICCLCAITSGRYVIRGITAMFEECMLEHQ